MILCCKADSGDIHLIYTVGKKNNRSRHNPIHKKPEKTLPSKAQWDHFYPCPSRQTQSRTHLCLQRCSCCKLWLKTGFSSTFIVDLSLLCLSLQLHTNRERCQVRRPNSCFFVTTRSLTLIGVRGFLSTNVLLHGQLCLVISDGRCRYQNICNVVLFSFNPEVTNYGQL